MSLHTLLPLLLLAPVADAAPAKPKPKVYVVLWFDTEDYLLPASDDAAMNVADFLTKQGIRGTFKVVGEKARTLEKRKRNDVIAALKKHEIGYHSNFHSVQPTPAMWASTLGWDEGVAEFDRREKGGFDDVARIFGTKPTCYGQPGSSWCPQSYGALKKWGAFYLDSGSHVDLDGRPCYYAGVLNLYKLTHTIRADLNKPDELEKAQARFVEARKKLLAEGGGIVSTVYHPCEWVHKKFWDGVNFSKGANPPREKWQLPPQKTADETKLSYRIFADYVAFMKRFDDVEFITASQAAKLYEDKSVGKITKAKGMWKVVEAVSDEPTFFNDGELTLSAAEIFDSLVKTAASRLRPREGAVGTGDVDHLRAPTPGILGPTSKVAPLTEKVTTDASQFTRTTFDVAEYLEKHGRLPGAVWLGSTPVPPEAYLRALAKLMPTIIDNKPLPASIDIHPTKLGCAKYVSDDRPGLWGWVIFPPGFKAPEMMDLARRQSWTLKPAVLGR